MFISLRKDNYSVSYKKKHNISCYINITPPLFIGV